MAENRIKLFHNAKIHTMDPHRKSATWLTAVAGRVQAIGDGPLPRAHTSIDLGGRTVVPGFVDAHAHFFQTGLDLLFVDLRGATTMAEIGRRITASNPGRRSWVFAHGFEEDELTDVERVTCRELDALDKSRPLWINRVDYHSAVVNSAALRRLDVPLGTPGLLVEDGQPLGILRSEAYFFGKARIARAYPIETKDRAVKTAAAEAVRHGITGVHALEGGKIFGDEGVATLLRRMEGLPVDVTLFLQEKNVYFTSKLGFEHLGGCILIDGSIGSYTAAIETDYPGVPGNRGVLYERTRELASFVEEAHCAGVQLAFHAIGPRAIEQLLNAYERALSRSPRYDHRHRIEHFELATDDQIKRARDLGLVISAQPSFELFWGGPKGMYASRLGEGWRQSNRLRSMLDVGVPIAGGSDSNVTPMDPLLGLHAAVNHPNPEQAVTPEQALRMMTIDAAFAGFRDRDQGSISPGKYANFTVLDKDPLKVRRTKIRDIRVLETWFRARRTYDAASEDAAGIG